MKWKENTDEFLEVFLILSDFVFEFLVEDLAVDMNSIGSPERRNSTPKQITNDRGTMLSLTPQSKSPQIISETTVKQKIQVRKDTPERKEESDSDDSG